MMERDFQERILMIAPQPCFDSRGAPFCVYQHIKALTHLGYIVDLVTYPMGETRSLPGLHMYRAPALPLLRKVKPGFSMAKLVLDLLVFFTALRRCLSTHYHYLHTHEEGGCMGIVLSTLFRYKHLYYMHCDLSELVGHNPLVKRGIAAVQRWIVRQAHAVITFYPELATRVRSIDHYKPVYTVLPPAIDEEAPPPAEEMVQQLRQRWQLEKNAQVLLYTGTLESYQGIELLLQSAPLVRASCPNTRFLIVGGTTRQVARLSKQAQQAGISDIVQFTGACTIDEIPCYMALATIMLSPRSQGTHTPLKLYTYLRSGKPILATNILSHSQILNDDLAHLVEPTADGLAQGIIELLHNPARAQALGTQGKRYAGHYHSWPAFLEKNRRVYQEFAQLCARA